MRPIRFALMLLAAATLVPGCASPEDVDEPEVHLPMAHDPTREFALAQWWSDGRQLLRLQEDGRYARYGTPSRYRPPVEVGRWDQASYAVLWLEPYESRTTRRVRIGIMRLEDDTLALQTPDGATLRPFDAPPAVAEDRLVGTWVSDRARLLIRADGRYWLEPAPQGGRILSEAGHIGRWTLDDDTVLLSPDGTALAPWSLRVDRESDPIRLRGEGTSYAPG